MSQDEVGANCWTRTPADAGAIFGDKPYINEPGPLSLKDIDLHHIPMLKQWPFFKPFGLLKDIKFLSHDLIVAKTVEYVQARLHPETFNHSVRVYYIGLAISKQQFPERYTVVDPSSWALTCLLHDIGTIEENLTATRMSFDIYGGIKALYIVKDIRATKDQAEATSEAIMRHEDMGVDGTITYFGQLIQLATTYDNTGYHPHVKHFGKMLHETTRAEIKEAHPRLKWYTSFSGTIRKEEEIKPWCHSTHLANLAKEIKENSLMKQWEF